MNPQNVHTMFCIVLVLISIVTISTVIEQYIRIWYDAVPKHETPIFYRQWVENQGGLSQVLKKYDNRLPKEFFSIFDTKETCAIALNCVSRKNCIVYTKIATLYIKHLFKEHHASKEYVLIDACTFYGKEYQHRTLFTKKITNVLLKKIRFVISKASDQQRLWQIVTFNTPQDCFLYHYASKRILVT